MSTELLLNRGTYFRPVAPPAHPGYASSGARKWAWGVRHKSEKPQAPLVTNDERRSKESAESADEC